MNDLALSTRRLFAPSLDDARNILRSVWKHDDFRPAQRRAVIAALRGRDCLAILPTGGGKSLCFQVPALLLPGLTLVVSPLISLMQDQVGALRLRGVAAAYLSSTQDAAEQAAVRAALVAGRVKLLYVAPERLPALIGRDLPPVALLAIDEAHCVSEWGHEFRPHYRELGRFRQALGSPPTIALTATATPATRADITQVLGMTRAVSVVASFDRPNLQFSAFRLAAEGARLHALRALLRDLSGSAVVYAPTRNRTDSVAALLRTWGLPAAPYHAGLPASARADLLERFLDGRVPVMVATSAFGMGIDQPNVRLVAHVGIPARPESYYQEAGRAGRDGRPARCVLLWLQRDLDFNARKAKPGGVRAHREAMRSGRLVMRRYVTTRGCRRRVLLGYLGEELSRCSGCDRCRT